MAQLLDNRMSHPPEVLTGELFMAVLETAELYVGIDLPGDVVDRCIEFFDLVKQHAKHSRPLAIDRYQEGWLRRCKDGDELGDVGARSDDRLVTHR